jgi:pimeloyl-ACP methyl ester carboxylesterase
MRIDAAYGFAQAAAGAIPNSAAIAVLRPGFSDNNGKTSPGQRGLGTGDNYTQPVLDAVAETIAVLRRRHPQAHVILVGDRGGAAIAADIAALKPGLADGIVLVSCPCALPEWRAYRAARDKARPWKAPVTSLDPLRSAGGVMPGLKAAILVGADDQNTPVRFSRTYAEALALRGIDTDYHILPGKGEAILGEPDVLAATQRMAQALDGKP